MISYNNINIDKLYKLLSLFAKHNYISREEFVQELGISRATSFRMLSALKRLGITIRGKKDGDNPKQYKITNWGIINRSKIK